MKIGFLKSAHAAEKRFTLTPSMVKKYINKGATVWVEQGAGVSANISDEDLEQAGAHIHSTAAEICSAVRVVVSMQLPAAELLKKMKPDAALVGPFFMQRHPEHVNVCAQYSFKTFSLELIPRISRAQNMDILSSQSNLAGYKAVLEAANIYQGAFPMMMTAAGLISPAKVLVLGAGVAGLQAIATAKRLGAQVSAFDVRPAVKEQVESLGAKFIEVKSEAASEDAGGYATEMSEDYKMKQQQLIANELKKTNIVITTALVPGKRAPTLITKDMVNAMPAGSVVIDMAAEAGGNCEYTKPDECVRVGTVSIAGYTDLPSRVAPEASKLLAQNIFHYLSPAINGKEIAFDLDDEVYKQTLVTQGGEVVHERFKQKES